MHRSLACLFCLTVGCGTSTGTSDGGGGAPDSGAVADAGGSADAGRDAGSITDAGVNDAGSTADAGGNPDSGASSDAGTQLNVCGAPSGTLAWTASIPAPATSLAPLDITAGPTNDVVVSDLSDSAALEISRWNSKGAFLSRHQDSKGSYAGTLFASTLFHDSQNAVFYGLLLTGLPQGSNSGAALSFTRLNADGGAIFSSTPQLNALPTSSGAPSVNAFQAGGDTGGGLHSTLEMGTPVYFPGAVYCWGSDGTDVGPSASNVAGILLPGDFLWPSLDASLYLAKPLTATTNFGCGTPLTVPAAGGVALAKFSGGGSCLWNKLLALPTAAVKQLAFRLGADASLVMAVVYSGTIDFGGGAFSSSGTNSLALARFDAGGNLIWAKSFGGTGSSFQLGSVGANATGNVMLTSHYVGAVDLGGGGLSASSDTFLAVFESVGTFKWSKQVKVGASGQLMATIGPCGLVLATNSPTVDLGTGPLSTVAPPAPASIGVAALGL